MNKKEMTAPNVSVDADVRQPPTLPRRAQQHLFIGLPVKSAFLLLFSRVTEPLSEKKGVIE